MSDKVREFVEIPQHFLKEGNQVSRPPPANVGNVAEHLLALLQFLTRCTKPSQKGM